MRVDRLTSKLRFASLKGGNHVLSALEVGEQREKSGESNSALRRLERQETQPKGLETGHCKQEAHLQSPALQDFLKHCLEYP